MLLVITVVHSRFIRGYVDNVSEASFDMLTL